MNDELLDVAFGSSPGNPPPRTADRPAENWLRAVTLGATGWYAAAAAELARIPASRADPVWRSLALSTRASHLRQAGDHPGARRLDGEALNAVARNRTTPIGSAAALDALTGLAADSLGTGHLDLAGRLLTGVGRELDVRVDDGPWMWFGRPRLRHAWVRTELALYRGDVGAAVASAAAAAALASDCPSVRHRLKTELIEAATAAAAGDGDEASRLAGRCVDTARVHGQLPLEWAATTLLLGVGSAGRHGDDPVAGDESRLRAELVARGAAFGER